MFKATLSVGLKVFKAKLLFTGVKQGCNKLYTAKMYLSITQVLRSLLDRKPLLSELVFISM